MLEEKGTKRAHPLEESLHKVVLGALTAELAVSAEAQKLVAAVAKQTLRSLVPQVHVVACRQEESAYVQGTSRTRRSLTMILAIDIVHLLIL